MEKEVIPTFYEDRKKWNEIMRSSIRTAVQFTAHRMIKEYEDKIYSHISKKAESVT